LVRDVTAADRDRILKGFERLSDRSRYQRFLGPLHRLTDAQLDHLADVDGIAKAAIAAVDVSAPGRPGVGLARYFRLPHDPSTAEAAITVIDDYQRLGIGRILFDRLCEIARRNGISAFVADMLTDNPARNLIRGLRVTDTPADGQVSTVRLEL
jgi:GNAT superfamily N-acetyltransferase